MSKPIGTLAGRCVYRRKGQLYTYSAFHKLYIPIRPEEEPKIIPCKPRTP